jgi:hypothetical protein
LAWLTDSWCIRRDDTSDYSQNYVEGDKPDPISNKNVEWLRYPHFWWCYIGLILFFMMLLKAVFYGTPMLEDWAVILTITNFVYNAVSCVSITQHRSAASSGVAYGPALQHGRYSSMLSIGRRGRRMSSARGSTTG